MVRNVVKEQLGVCKTIVKAKKKTSLSTGLLEGVKSAAYLAFYSRDLQL